MPRGGQACGGMVIHAHHFNGGGGYEIADYVQACKEDLDHVGRLAKRALKRANQET